MFCFLCFDLSPCVALRGPTEQQQVSLHKPPVQLHPTSWPGEQYPLFVYPWPLHADLTSRFSGWPTFCLLTSLPSDRTLAVKGGRWRNRVQQVSLHFPYRPSSPGTLNCLEDTTLTLIALGYGDIRYTWCKLGDSIPVSDIMKCCRTLALVTSPAMFTPLSPVPSKRKRGVLYYFWKCKLSILCYTCPLRQENMSSKCLHSNTYEGFPGLMMLLWQKQTLRFSCVRVQSSVACALLGRGMFSGHKSSVSMVFRQWTVLTGHYG